MNAPHPLRESHNDAPVPVHRKRRSLKRHWLTGALVCVAVGLTGRTAVSIFETEQRIHDVQVQRQEIEQQIQEAKQRNASLQSELDRVSSDSYREVMAKQLGFVHPNETVYQKGK